MKTFFLTFVGLILATQSWAGPSWTKSAPPLKVPGVKVPGTTPELPAGSLTSECPEKCQRIYFRVSDASGSCVYTERQIVNNAGSIADSIRTVRDYACRNLEGLGEPCDGDDTQISMSTRMADGSLITQLSTERVPDGVFRLDGSSREADYNFKILRVCARTGDWWLH